MAMGTLVESALSNALKTLMLKKPIRQITVKEITDACGLSRHTFYNHFHDVYELLAWTYNQEIIDGMEQYCNRSEWDKALKMVLDYTGENRKICLNTFDSLGRDHLERFLYVTFYKIVDAVAEDIVYETGFVLKEKDCRNCKEFYTNALIGNFTAWLKSDLKETPEEFGARLIPMLQGIMYVSLNNVAQKQTAQFA